MKDFNEWRISEMFSDAVSLVEAFYTRAGSTLNRDLNKEKLTKEEEREYAKKSNLQTRLKIGNWFVKPTIHAAAQSYIRVPEITSQQWVDMHKRMVNTIGKVTDIPNDYETEIIFYSKSLNQAYVVAHDPEKSELRIMTVLPRGKQFAKPGTKKIMMESPIEVFYLELNEDDDNHVFESCVMSEEEIRSYAAMRGDALGLSMDYDEPCTIVDAQPDNPEGIAQYVKINVPFKRSPDGEVYTGCVNFEIYRPGGDV